MDQASKIGRGAVVCRALLAMLLTGVVWPLILTLAACDTRSARIDAIAEVEAACGLPPGSLPRYAAEKPVHEGRFAIVESSGVDVEIRRVIDLGQVPPSSPILRKRECIVRYKSKDAYWFGIYTFSPPVLPEPMPPSDTK